MLPTGLSMLWERAPAGVALEERFGFAGEAGVARWVSEVLHRSWGITAGPCSRVVISSTNAVAWVASDRGPLVVKCSRAADRFDDLEASTALVARLAERGVPVAAPVASVTGHLRERAEGPRGKVSVAVAPELAGAWLDVDDATAVSAAGACLAHLHQALGTVTPAPATPAVAIEPGPRVAGWLTFGDARLAPAASRRLADLVAAAPALDTDVQHVHNDFRAANILTRGSRVVGVLDFDDVVVDHPVHDLAKASTYLGTLFTDWRPTAASAQQALRAGYESVRPLSSAEARWLEVLLLWHGIMAIPGGEDPAGWADAVRPR